MASLSRAAPIAEAAVGRPEWPRNEGVRGGRRLSAAPATMSIRRCGRAWSSTNSRCPSASAAVSRPLAVRTTISISSSPGLAERHLAPRGRRSRRGRCARSSSHRARVAADLDHRHDRVADHVALPGREHVDHLARRGLQRARLGRRARRVHEVEARALRRRLGRLERVDELRSLPSFSMLPNAFSSIVRQAAGVVALGRLAVRAGRRPSCASITSFW